MSFERFIAITLLATLGVANGAKLCDSNKVAILISMFIWVKHIDKMFPSCSWFLIREMRQSTIAVTVDFWVRMLVQMVVNSDQIFNLVSSQKGTVMMMKAYLFYAKKAMTEFTLFHIPTIAPNTLCANSWFLLSWFVQGVFILILFYMFVTILRQPIVCLCRDQPRLKLLSHRPQHQKDLLPFKKRRQLPVVRRQQRIPLKRLHQKHH